MAERFDASVRLPETVNYEAWLVDRGFQDRRGTARSDSRPAERRLLVTHGTREAFVTVTARTTAEAEQLLRAALAPHGGNILAGPELAT